MSSNSTSAPSAPATEEQLDALLRESQEADASARDARLWASPAYVAEKEAAAEAAWAAYRAASETTTTTITPEGVVIREYPVVRYDDGCSSQRLDFTSPEGEVWSELVVRRACGNFRTLAVKRQKELQSKNWGVYREDNFLMEGGFFYRDSALDCAANLR